MADRRIYLLTDYSGLFRQALYDYQGLHLGRLSEYLSSAGYTAEIIRFADVYNRSRNLDIGTDPVLYTSSGRLPYKRYLDDVLFEVSKHGYLIPSYDLFRAHENKGYQEIIKARLGINDPKGWYFGSLEELSDSISDLPFPCVFKMVFGAGSARVFKCDTPRSLLRLTRSTLADRRWSARRFLRTWVLRRPDREAIRNESAHLGQIVVQQFVPGLTHDWKVLVFGSRVFAVRRGVRRNDFRASGSGLLAFEDPPKAVLDYAACIRRLLDTPFVSLDVADTETGCRLIEFQAVHFGPTALLHAPCCYEGGSGSWERIEGSFELEAEMCRSIDDYLRNRPPDS